MAARSANQHSNSQGPWFISQPFDYGLILGGAFLTLALPILGFALPAALPIMFWTWVIFFEGTHFCSTWTRTYFDPKYFAEHRSFLVGSSALFVIPAIIWSLHISNPISIDLELYGFLIFCWSLYHNTRQHYGFVSLYLRKETYEDLRTKRRLRDAVYLAIIPPQIYFLMKFKLALAYPVFHNALSSIPSMTESVCLVFTAVAVVVLAWIYFSSTAFKQKRLPIHFSYVAGCLVYFSLMFYVVAGREPFFPKHQNNAQLLMMIAVMSSLFHNIQYLAIVGIYGRKRLALGKASGLAQTIHRYTLNYLTVCTLAGLGFGWIVWNLGNWTNLSGDWVQRGAHPWAIILFWGIIGHHFYLDQKIWRPSKQVDVQESLAIEV